MEGFIKQLNEWFGEKAPALPTKAKEVIVKIAPWLSLVMVVLAAPAVLALIGFGGYVGRYAIYGSYGGGWYWIFAAATIVLNILALPGLFKPSKSGWMFSFYAVLVGGVQNIVMMNLGGLIIGLAIGFYILFQIKAYYFGGAMVPPTKPTTPAAPTV
jgi:hypothetical protein